MKKRALKKIAILVAPVIWRKIRGRRSRHRWHRRHRWHGRPHFRRHKRRGIWL